MNETRKKKLFSLIHFIHPGFSQVQYNEKSLNIDTRY